MMRLYVQCDDDAEPNDKWTWSLESNDGKHLAQGVQSHSTRRACEKELNAIVAALPNTGISERRVKSTKERSDIEDLPDKPQEEQDEQDETDAWRP